MRPGGSLASNYVLIELRRVVERYYHPDDSTHFGAIMENRAGERQHFGRPANRVFAPLVERTLPDAEARGGYAELQLPLGADERPRSLYVLKINFPDPISGAPETYIWAVTDSRDRPQHLPPLALREFAATCEAYLLAAFSATDPFFILSKAFEAAAVNIALRVLMSVAEADAAILWIYHREGQYFETDTVEGAARGRYVLGLGRGVVGRVNPILGDLKYPTKDTMNITPYHPDLVHSENWARIQAFPVKWRGALIGAISLYWTAGNSAPFISSLDASRVGALASGLVATQQAELALDEDLERFEKQLVRLAPAQALLSFIHDVQKSLNDVTTAMNAAAVRLGQSSSAGSRELSAKLTSSARFVDGCLNRMGRLALLQQRTSALKKTDLCRLLREMNQLLQTHTTVKVGLDLPPRSVWVLADRLSLERAILNVTANAIFWTEARPKGRRKVTIGLSSDVAAATIRVTDTGVGIGPEVRDRVFERFVTGRPESGSGMGLHIVREVMRVHGGDVTFESALGKGTTFKLSIPLVKGSSDG